MPKPQVESAIPVGTQFSPNLIDLPSFVRAITSNSGNRDAMLDAIWKPDVRVARPKKQPTRRTRALPLEAAIQYGLVEEKTFEVTNLARGLSVLGDADLYDEFARHILLNLGGLRVVEAVREMARDGRKITGPELAAYLTDQGFRVTIQNTAINTMRMYLARAGIFPTKGWDVDVEERDRLLGLDDSALGVLVGLDIGQRAFVLALCAINPSGDTPAADVRALAEGQSGLRLSRSSLPKEFLEPLRAAGLITYASKGTGAGKTATLRLTDKFHADVLRPFLERTLDTMDAVVAAYYQQRPEDIYSELDSDDTFKKGQALEAYAIHVMRLLGLRFVGWRKRAKDTTGRAEVDAVMSGAVGVVPTRWQVQCKNTPKGNVDVEDVAKEVGVASITKANNILIVANCNFTKDARDYADQVTAETAMNVMLIDGRDFAKIKASPGRIGGILREKAESAVHRKSSTIWMS